MLCTQQSVPCSQICCSGVQQHTRDLIMMLRWCPPDLCTIEINSERAFWCNRTAVPMCCREEHKSGQIIRTTKSGARTQLHIIIVGDETNRNDDAVINMCTCIFREYYDELICTFNALVKYMRKCRKCCRPWLRCSFPLVSRVPPNA